jgi:hypothetical protein
VGNLRREVTLFITEGNYPELRVKKSVSQLNRTILLHNDTALFVARLFDPRCDLFGV